jgi:hypothetical protein
VRLTNARRAIASIVIRSKGSSASASRAASRISDSVSLREVWGEEAIATAYAAARGPPPHRPAHDTCRAAEREQRATLAVPHPRLAVERACGFQQRCDVGAVEGEADTGELLTSTAAVLIRRGLLGCRSTARAA